MKERIAILLGPITLLEWGGILLYFYFSGRINALLHPVFRWQVLVAGSVLVLCAAVLFLTQKKTAQCACGADDDCGLAQRSVLSGNWLVPLMLLLPFGLATLVSTDAYGANILQTRGVANNAAALPGLADKFAKAHIVKAVDDLEIVEPPLPTDTDLQSSPDDPPSTPPADEPVNNNDSLGSFLKPDVNGNIQVSVTDLLYAAEEPTLQPPFRGKSAEIIGQFMPAKTNNASGKRFNLVRMFMTCCAADAQPVSVLVDTSESGILPNDVGEMVWTRVVGHIEFPMENGKPIAVLKAKTVEKTAPPEETMLY
ncbi:MAG TPA: DUF1980 domain-containing protein [Chthoniobacterales bacterium]